MGSLHNNLMGTGDGSSPSLGSNVTGFHGALLGTTEAYK